MFTVVQLVVVVFCVWKSMEKLEEEYYMATDNGNASEFDAGGGVLNAGGQVEQLQADSVNSMRGFPRVV
jgi:hypothetical protein